MSVAMFTYGTRLALEYPRDLERGLQAVVKSGFATVGQKSKLVGMRVLAEARLPSGYAVPVGSTAYVPWKLLHEAPWAKDLRECDALPGVQVLMVDVAHVDVIAQPGAKP